MRIVKFLFLLSIFIFNVNESVGQEEVEKNNPYIKSLLICKDGNIIFNQYYHQTNQNELINVYSITKTVTGLALGMAIKAGLIHSIEDKVSTYLPQYFDMIPKTSPLKNLTIYQLLTMQTGFKWDLAKELGLLDFRINHLKKIIELNANKPNTNQFCYDDFNTHLLSKLIENLTHKTLSNYVSLKLFKPLGIDSFKWITDLSGSNIGGYGLWLKSKDVLKLGNYLLKSYSEPNNSVLAKSYLLKMTIPSSTGGWPGQSPYGLLLWLNMVNRIQYYYSLGYNGQYMVMVPSKKMVIVLLNGDGYKLDSLLKPRPLIESLILKY